MFTNLSCRKLDGSARKADSLRELAGRARAAVPTGLGEALTGVMRGSGGGVRHMDTACGVPEAAWDLLVSAAPLRYWRSVVIARAGMVLRSEIVQNVLLIAILVAAFALVVGLIQVVNRMLDRATDRGELPGQPPDTGTPHYGAPDNRVAGRSGGPVAVSVRGLPRRGHRDRQWPDLLPDADPRPGRGTHLRVK